MSDLKRRVARKPKAPDRGRESPPFGRSQLQHIIAGLTDGVLLVEPDQRIAWANSAALAMHGVRRVEDLGRTVDEYRSRFELRYRNRHKLPTGAYPLDRLVGGESFSQIVVEVGRPGQEAQWTHQIRSLVLTDAGGVPNCLVLIINDVTEQYLAESRFETSFNANPAPGLICRLSDTHYIKVNHGFLALTGFKADDLLGKSLHAIDVLVPLHGRDAAVELFHAGKTIPQTEAWLPVRGGGHRRVLLAGQAIDVDDTACMLFTFADLQPAHDAQQALAQSERRFATAFRLAPVPMLVLEGPDLLVVDSNESFSRTTGHPRSAASGRPVHELALWDEDTGRLVAQALRLGEHLGSVEIDLQYRDRRTRAHLLAAERVVVDDKACLLVVLHDIGDRKRTESDLVSAIEAVLRDTRWFGQRVMEKLAELPGHETDRAGQAADQSLSEREREILGSIAQGHTDARIAGDLAISRSTVRNHVTAIFRKIGVCTRSAAVVWAREHGYGAKMTATPRSSRRSQNPTTSRHISPVKPRSQVRKF